MSLKYDKTPNDIDGNQIIGDTKERQLGAPINFICTELVKSLKTIMSDGTWKKYLSI